MIADDQLPDGPGAYVAHFAEPLEHARNYIGSAADIRARIADQRAGRNAAKIIEAVQARPGPAGEWHVARFWPTATHEAAWQTEIALKNRRDTPRICPDCTPGAESRAAAPEPASRRTGPHHPPVRKPAAQPAPEPHQWRQIERSAEIGALVERLEAQWAAATAPAPAPAAAVRELELEPG